MRINSINNKNYAVANPRFNVQNYRNTIPQFKGENDTFENSNKDSELKVKGPSIFNGFDGKIKGNFGGVDVDFEIDQRILTLLDKKNLVGTYKIGDETKKTNLEFNQKFTLGHTYGIKGNFGNKTSDIRFQNPIIKYSNIGGNYNNKPVDLEINRKLTNLIRNEYTLKGTLNGKDVDLHCKGLFFFGGGIKGTFNGKPVTFDSSQHLNPFIDKRDINVKMDLNNDDKEDLLFLSSAMTINDLFLMR